MAGIRQHILPKFLLKGFASRKTARYVFTWVYPKQGPIYEANTINVSVEKHFYGREGETSVDSAITDFELRYAPLVRDLRAMEHGTPIYDERAAELVTHLCTRTKHMRDSFRESSECLIGETTQQLFNTDILKMFSSNNPALLRRVIDNSLRNSSLPGAMKDMFAQIDTDTFCALLDQAAPLIEQFAPMLRTELQAALPGAIRSGHIQALAKDLTPKPRLEVYRALNWFVCASSRPLILGDSGCVFEIAESGKFRPLSEHGDRLGRAFLPIATDRLLLGIGDGSAPQFEPTALNEATAACTRDYFVSSEHAPDLVNLQKIIGENSASFTKQELERLIGELIQEITGRREV